MFGAQVYNLYGQTELAPVLSLTRPRDRIEDRRSTVGRPLPQVDCKVIDPVTGELVGIGETGEICARGYQQFMHYLDDPAATSAALDADGFVRTGDLGAMDAGGYLTITGRLKEIIIRGGENIAPAHIERVLCQHHSVVEAVVVGIPDERLGETVVAALKVVAPGLGLKEELASHARAALAYHQVPVSWYLIETVPVTSTGKPRRFEVREAILSGMLAEL